MFLSITGALACCAWVYLLVGRGGFWLLRDRAPAGGVTGEAPRVAAVIPARNEAGVVARAVASLAQQQYAGAFHVVLVDDGSDDGTAGVARAAAPAGMLTVLRGRPLPDGWTGKLWALSQGVEQAGRFSPEYLLLTDADIVHPATGLRDLVAQARSGYELVSWMVMLPCTTVAERVLLPAYVFFFFLLYPPSWTRSPRFRTAGAAGGCMLIRREMLEKIGGVASIRGALIDDCALAHAVKRHGGRAWLGVSGDARSIRPEGGFLGIGRMISRTAFTQLDHSAWWLAGVVAGIGITFVVPPVAALLGNRFAAAAWVMMAVSYVPMLRYYRRSTLWAPLLPAVAMFYLGATVHSAASYWLGTGGMWKGRVQDKR